MMTVRKSGERGGTDHGWLSTRHTFSFATYRDSRYTGFHALRVINEDRVRAGKGFGEHPHRDMEIVTYVISGTLAHEDSLGHGDVLRRGDVQAMTAGTGLTHAEFNPSDSEPVHFLQLWLLPDRRGATPAYAQQHFADADKRNRLLPIASGDGRNGSLSIGADAAIFASLLEAGHELTHSIAAGRAVWVQLISGNMTVNGTPLSAGDGASVQQIGAGEITLAATTEAELLLFDLA